MITVMTNEGALEFGRSLSGGSRFLAWEAALVNGAFANVQDAVELSSADVNLSTKRISGMDIVRTFECTGSLPVKVSSEEGGTVTKAMAVDFDFNGQAPIEAGESSIAYSTVVALGRRFREYPQASMGSIYHIGDHVWAYGDPERKYAYVCVDDNGGAGFEYEGVPVNQDSAHWMAVETANLVRHPIDPDYFSDPFTYEKDGTVIPSDTIPFFVTSYDNEVVMANGMEWEYKVRVFLDNVVNSELAKLNYFSRGGLEANGSLMLTFLASISEQFRAIRDTVSTAS